MSSDTERTTSRSLRAPYCSHALGNRPRVLQRGILEGATRCADGDSKLGVQDILPALRGGLIPHELGARIRTVVPNEREAIEPQPTRIVVESPMRRVVPTGTCVNSGSAPEDGTARLLADTLRPALRSMRDPYHGSAKGHNQPHSPAEAPCAGTQGEPKLTCIDGYATYSSGVLSPSSSPRVAQARSHALTAKPRGKLHGRSEG